MYRNPGWLLGIGCIVAALAVVAKALPIISKELWSGTGKEGFDVAASAVDPTLMALAGGLIGAAFVLKVQWLYENERDRLLDILKMEEHNLAQDMQRTHLTDEDRDSWIEAFVRRSDSIRKIHKRLRQLSGGQIDLDEHRHISSDTTQSGRCRDFDRSNWSD